VVNLDKLTYAGKPAQPDQHFLSDPPIWALRKEISATASACAETFAAATSLGPSFILPPKAMLIDPSRVLTTFIRTNVHGTFLPA